MKNIIINLKALLLQASSDLPQKVGKILTERKLTISSAESCTGGLVSSRLTDVSGSSAYVKENYVTYSNDAKHKILSVSEETLQKYGAVSAQCAREMAEGLLKITGSDIVICTTGVAGPTGSEQKPVGLMFASCGYNNNIIVKEFRLNKNYLRKNMKFMFSEEALRLVLSTLEKYL